MEPRRPLPAAGGCARRRPARRPAARSRSRRGAVSPRGGAAYRGCLQRTRHGRAGLRLSRRRALQSARARPGEPPRRAVAPQRRWLRAAGVGALRHGGRLAGLRRRGRGRPGAGVGGRTHPVRSARSPLRRRTYRAGDPRQRAAAGPVACGCAACGRRALAAQGPRRPARPCARRACALPRARGAGGLGAPDRSPDRRRDGGGG